MMFTMEDELKEKERICNLSREDLVREYVDGLSVQEMIQYVYEGIYADDCDHDDDTLRHILIHENT